MARQIGLSNQKGVTASLPKPSELTEVIPGEGEALPPDQDVDSRLKVTSESDSSRLNVEQEMR